MLSIESLLWIVFFKWKNISNGHINNIFSGRKHKELLAVVTLGKPGLPFYLMSFYAAWLFWTCTYIAFIVNIYIHWGHLGREILSTKDVFFIFLLIKKNSKQMKRAETEPKSHQKWGGKVKGEREWGGDKADVWAVVCSQVVNPVASPQWAWGPSGHLKGFPLNKLGDAGRTVLCSAPLPHTSQLSRGQVPQASSAGMPSTLLRGLKKCCPLQPWARNRV